MRNGSPTTITIFTDSHTAITKILDQKVGFSRDAIQDLIYQNAFTIKNNGHTLVLQ